ncbi:MAG TPA: TMEM175 family protein [Sporichthyaceae bacterium]|jgi:uncharacterized membrane protein|nr:TMEM175 family protein [Sporichthyaceae bacterium]
MPTSRLEAFSDGVLAIIITIMVLELKVPEGNDLGALQHTAGTELLTYLLSFVYVGIYWNNHHHMFHLTKKVTGGVLWANLHLLFWLSLFPFTTAWMARSDLARTPVMIYGVNQLGAAIAFYVLQTAILREEGANCALARAVGHDLKGKISPVLYLCGIVVAGFAGSHEGKLTWAGLAFFVGVAVMWLIPDRRIERVLAEESTG